MENLGKKLSDEELENRISFLGTDLDDIDDGEVVVEVFPNRPDMLSEQGFARALSSFIGEKTGFRDYKVEKSGEKVIVDESVEQVRPYTACAIIRGLDLDEDNIEEIINMQEKLHVTYGRNRRKVAIGLYPLEKIETPIHYKALSPEDIEFQPLESDERMTASEILEEHPKGVKFGHLLEDENVYPIFADNNGEVLSMPPIINSDTVGRVDENTEELFIECSGHDFRVLNKALNMLVTTFADMGGKIQSMKLEYPDSRKVTPDLTPEKLEVEVDYVNKKLGLDLDESELQGLVERMGFGYDKGEIVIPAYRSDVLHPVDLVEDIAIAYGFDEFTAEIPNVATIGDESKEGVVLDKVRDVLVGHGLIEVKNYSLSNERVQNEMMNMDMGLVELANSLSEEYNVMRVWMIPCLLKNLSENKHYEYPQNIFEVGPVFKKGNESETGVEEADRVAVALCGEDADYTKAKQVLENVFESLGVEAEYEETEHPSFVPGRASRVYVNGKGVVYMGEVHPEVLENFDLEMPVSTFELNISDLLEVTDIV